MTAAEVLGGADDDGLSAAEIDRLHELVKAASDGKGMSVEWIDGYFAALVSTPTLVTLDDYLPPIFGVESIADVGFENMECVRDALQLLTKQRNIIASALLASLTDVESFHWPILLEDDDGVARGNEWAQGFLKGTIFDRKAWAALMDDESHGGSILPIFALAYENDPDPAMRPAPVDTPERRETLIQHLIVGLVKLYAYFEPARRASAARAPVDERTIVRDGPKVGRNDPCPCGSGKKYKRCHGAT